MSFQYWCRSLARLRCQRSRRRRALGGEASAGAEMEPHAERSVFSQACPPSGEASAGAEARSQQP